MILKRKLGQKCGAGDGKNTGYERVCLGNKRRDFFATWQEELHNSEALFTPVELCGFGCFASCGHVAKSHNTVLNTMSI